MTTYSIKEHRILLHPLGTEGLYYAFNYEDPNGVKLLTSVAAQRLTSILNREAHFDVSNSIDRSLSTSGLISGNIPSRKESENKLSVWLHVVNACNLSCSYCYIHKLRKAVKPESGSAIMYSMKYENVPIIADRLVAYCNINGIEKLHIKFAGGEPTLDIGLIDYFCKYIKSQTCVSVSFGLLTNGVFDYANIIPILQEHNISLSISLDGHGHTHDEIRFEMHRKRRQGTWNKILNNIKRALSEGISPYLLYTVTPSNSGDLIIFSDMVHDLGLGYRLSLVRSADQLSPNVQHTIIENLIKLYTRLGDTLDENMPIARYAKFSEWNLNKKKDIVCTAIRKYVAIDQDGAISSCQMNMDNKYGSLLTDPLESSLNIMKGDIRLAAIANPALRCGICTHCEYFYVCSGGCPEHTIKSFGTVDLPSPWCVVFYNLVPVYIESIARQMLRKLKNRI